MDKLIGSQIELLLGYLKGRSIFFHVSSDADDTLHAFPTQ